MAITLPILQDWRFSIDFEGIAWAIIDRKGESMNSLGRRPTEELGEIVKAVEKAAASGEAKGLVIMSAKETSFIAGADIREFQNFDTEEKIKDVVRQTLELFDRIDRLPVTAGGALSRGDPAAAGARSGQGLRDEGHPTAGAAARGGAIPRAGAEE